MMLSRHRVSKSDSSGTTSYKRAGAYVTDSLLKSTVSSTTTDYTPGVSSRVGSDSAFLHSGIKNADTQTDDGGDVSAMRRYDAFGNPMAAWGGWHGPFGYGGPYGGPYGYQTDNDHGLMLLGHRYYEADTGRFLTRDPIKDGRNWYGYCGNSPLAFSDPDGSERLILVRNKGGLTAGSHLVIGLEDAKRRTTYYGFYPSPEVAGEMPHDRHRGFPGLLPIISPISQGEWIIRNWPRKEYKGWVRVNDSPKPQEQLEYHISLETFLNIRNKIMGSRAEYLRHEGRAYLLGNYNCAHWGLKILKESGVLSGIDDLTRPTLTPANVLQLADSILRND
jgi:RHS repeat-associated protein